MTVANNNLPSALLGNSAVNLQAGPVIPPANSDASMNVAGNSQSGQLAVNNSDAAPSQTVNTGDDFETILHQQLIDNDSIEKVQVIDNKGINLGLIDFELTQQVSEPEIQPIHQLKSHFLQLNAEEVDQSLSDPINQLSTEAIEVVLQPQQEIPIQAVSRLPIADDVKLSEKQVTLNLQGGEALPPSGQIVSAVKTESNVKHAVNLLDSKPMPKPSQVPNVQPAMSSPPVNLTEKSTISGSKSEVPPPNLIGAEENISDDIEIELSQEKPIFKKMGQNSNANQAPVSAIKEAVSAVTATTNPVLTSQTQNVSANQLPQHLQTMSLSPQSTNTQWGEALNERVSFLVNHKLNRAEIRLDPPHLGKLDIQIQVKDDAATITIHTQHAHTRDIIDSASARLRDFLQEAGYESVNVDVSHQEQSPEQQLAEQGQGTESDDALSSTASDIVPDSDLTATSMDIQLDNGRIDFFA